MNKNRVVLQLIVVVMAILFSVSGCGAPTREEKQNIKENFEKFGNYRNEMPRKMMPSLISIFAVFTGAVAFLYRCLADSRMYNDFKIIYHCPKITLFFYEYHFF